MSLKSESFRGDPNLEAAMVSNPAHILKGAIGDHVSKIQRALMQLDGIAIDLGELGDAQYGQSTEDAVLAYKQKRDIVNHSYQEKADNITGKMTMAFLDKEIFAKESVDPDFIFLSDGQKAIVKADLLQSKQMLDVVLRRLQIVANTTPSGGLLVTPRNLALYDAKLKILNVFRINTFSPDDLPAPRARVWHLIEATRVSVESTLHEAKCYLGIKRCPTWRSTGARPFASLLTSTLVVAAPG